MSDKRDKALKIVAELINTQIKQWDTERELEKLVGRDLGNLGECIKLPTVCIDFYVGPTDPVVEEVLKQIEEAHECRLS